MNNKNIEDQLRTILRENFCDLEPPVDFVQNVMNQLPKSAPEPVSFFNKSNQLGHRIWNRLTRQMTISVSPLQVAASCLVVFCSVFILYKASFEQVNAGRNGLQAALNDSGLKPVAFTLHDPHRKFSSAVVIGSFNKWQSRGFEMTYDESQQTWVLEHALPAGDYQYVFLIDGESSMPDPRAVFYIQDSFGNKNSLLQVGGVQHAL